MIISILAGLKVQQQELQEIKSVFQTLDVNNDGLLCSHELQAGLQNVCFFELLQNHKDGDE